MGPAISDYSTWLILLTVIQLSGGHCSTYSMFQIKILDDEFKQKLYLVSINETESE